MGKRARAFVMRYLFNAMPHQTRRAARRGVRARIYEFQRAPNNTAAASRIIKRTNPGQMSDYGRALASEMDAYAEHLFALHKHSQLRWMGVQLASTDAPAAATSQVKR